MESQYIPIPAGSPLVLALAAPGHGETIRRASFIFQGDYGLGGVVTPWPSTLTMTLQQYRGGVALVTDLATYTGPVSAPLVGVPQEFVMPATLDLFTVFQEGDGLMLVVTQTGAVVMNGLLSWY